MQSSRLREDNRGALFCWIRNEDRNRFVLLCRLLNSRISLINLLLGNDKFLLELGNFGFNSIMVLFLPIRKVLEMPKSTKKHLPSCY